MAYSRFSRKRVTRGRSRFGRRRFGARVRSGVTRRIGVYRRFNRGRSMMKGGRGPELKVFDLALSTGAAAGLTICGSLLNDVAQDFSGVGISQGAGINQRLGKMITLKHIMLNASIVPYENGVPNVNYPDMCVFYLVVDTQCNGAIPWAAGVPTPFTGYVQTNQYVNQAESLRGTFMNPTNVGRFRVLKRKIIKPYLFENTTGGSKAGMPTMINWALKCNIPIEYDVSTADGGVTTGVAGLIGQIKRNNLFWCLIASANYQNQISVATRVRFADN